MVTGLFFECFQLHQTWRGFALPSSLWYFFNLQQNKICCSLCQYWGGTSPTHSNQKRMQYLIRFKCTLYLTRFRAITNPTCDEQRRMCQNHSCKHEHFVLHTFVATYLEYLLLSGFCFESISDTFDDCPVFLQQARKKNDVSHIGPN